MEEDWNVGYSCLGTLEMFLLLQGRQEQVPLGALNYRALQELDVKVWRYIFDLKIPGCMPQAVVDKERQMVLWLDLTRTRDDQLSLFAWNSLSFIMEPSMSVLGKSGWLTTLCGPRTQASSLLGSNLSHQSPHQTPWLDP